MVTLLLVVPDSADNLDELLVKLPRVSLQQLVQEWLPHSDISVSLPQLTIVSNAIDVTPFLRQLGMRLVFNATSADLSVATAAPAVHVKSVIQDAFFSTSFVSVNSVGSLSANLGKSLTLSHCKSANLGEGLSTEPLSVCKSGLEPEHRATLCL
jgi:hypothetical protein